MKRYCILLGVLLLTIGAFSTEGPYAQRSATVMVLPFDVYASEEFQYLREELPKILGERLQDSGAAVAAPVLGATADDEAQLRQVGRSAGSDYVIWGSITWIGQRFSIDVRMLDSFGTTPPKVFNEEGEGIENLSSRVSDLTQRLKVDIMGLVVVEAVRVEGNNRIETDAIQKAIRIQPGDIFSAKAVNDDLKSVHGLGYFDDVRVDTIDVPEGKTLIFRVKEKPTIRGIRIKGNDIYDDEAVLQSLTVGTGAVLNLTNVRSSIERIEELYEEKNYHNAQVDYAVEPLDNNQVNLVFDINEGSKVRIKSIDFEGNEAFSDKKLRKVMETKEKGLFSWITSSGELDEERLAQDVVRVQQYYQSQGYISARVSEPIVVFEEDWIDVTLKVSEGERYRLGEVKFSGDLIQSEEDLRKSLEITESEYFNRELLQKDILSLQDVYGNEGFAYADVRPKIDQDNVNLKVDVDYTIEKGKPVYFDEIIIGGNTKTRDKVIRRQLRVYEQELYNGSELKSGIQRLHRLDYFQDIKVNTVRGEADDTMTLKIDVEEKPTGMVSFGGGFSSVDSLFGVVSVDERNLFGRGQLLGVKAQLGGSSTRYDLRFTEPWLFDIPLAASVSAYKWKYEFDEYDKDSIGSALSLGYPVFKHTRFTATYELDLTDIDITDEKNVSSNIQKLEGENLKSAVAGTLRYDTTNDNFNPTRGQFYSLTNEYAGFGGDIGYYKVSGESGWYIPFFDFLTGVVKFKGGYVTGTKNGILPDYERFYIGGINTIRGVDRDDINPREKDRNNNSALIGGNRFVVINLELVFPISKDIGLMGLAFLDTGDSYDNGEDFDPSSFVRTVGGGIRWFSPFGPLRLEYGHVIESGDTDATGGKFEFSIGRTF
jgi:outer membrane protein insertion porin family